jgi:hypothetical protein
MTCRSRSGESRTGAWMTASSTGTCARRCSWYRLIRKTVASGGVSAEKDCLPVKLHLRFLPRLPLLAARFRAGLAFLPASY